MKREKKNRIPLRNGCSRNELFISPRNYKSLRSKNDLHRDWFVECRFFDPNFPKYEKGFQFRRRPGRQDNISEQKKVIEHLKMMMEEILDVQNYNPITKSFMEDESDLLSPEMDFKSALIKAQKKLNASEKHLKQVEYAVIRFCAGLDRLEYSFLNIKDVKIHHIKTTLESLDLPPYYFNKFRGYLTVVFKELIEYGCIDHNPLRDISKKTVIREKREIFTEEKLKVVLDYLKENYYPFYRYTRIFLYSGSRSSELLRVKKKDVDLENQEYSLNILKGKTNKWVTKVITDEALPYWIEIMDLAEDDEDYLFTAGQVPGPVPVLAAAITRRWYKLVKTKPIFDKEGNEYSVTEDFYSLKHFYLDKLDELQQNQELMTALSDNLAKTAAAHTTNRTTGIYAVGRKEREMEILKKIKIGL